MKSPRDMRVIQIDVTNACVHECSNCTRFCGHHKKPFFMDFETFKRAVDSLEGYVGTVGIMGGEPTLNPEFPRFCQYLAEHRHPLDENGFIRPVKEFEKAVRDRCLHYTYAYDSGRGVRQTVNGAGLWSVAGRGYKKYYELIQDTFQYQAINDHSSDDITHQPILVSRKELGIDDSEWLKLRDNCWVQNEWSATITPKGAFFCEIAGALDMLFDGPGGWPVKSGWWKRQPSDFRDQLHWCEMCGLACKTFMRSANEVVDDISPALLQKMQGIGSPKLKEGKYNVLEFKDGEITEESKSKAKRNHNFFVGDNDDRFNENSNILRINRFKGIITCNNEEAEKIIDNNIEYFFELYVLTETEEREETRCKMSGKSRIIWIDRRQHTIGYTLYRALYNEDIDIYAVFIDGNVQIKKELMDVLNDSYLNPGTMLFSSVKETEHRYWIQNRGRALACINGNSMSIARLGWDNILKIEDFYELKQLWIPEKVVQINTDLVRMAPNYNIVPGKRYAVYGAGKRCRRAIERIKKNGSEVVAVIDSDPNKWEREIYGFSVKRPEYLLEYLDEFDLIFITPVLQYASVKERITGMGISESIICQPI